jgi:hypothetical protein
MCLHLSFVGCAADSPQQAEPEQHDAANHSSSQDKTSRTIPDVSVK